MFHLNSWFLIITIVYFWHVMANQIISFVLTIQASSNSVSQSTCSVDCLPPSHNIPTFWNDNTLCWYSFHKYMEYNYGMMVNKTEYEETKIDNTIESSPIHFRWPGNVYCTSVTHQEIFWSKISCYVSQVVTQKGKFASENLALNASGWLLHLKNYKIYQKSQFCTSILHAKVIL